MIIKWNIPAFRQIRFDPKMVAHQESLANNLHSACGGSEAGYEIGRQAGKSRPRRTVITARYRAMRDNARNNTLARNLDAIG